MTFVAGLTGLLHVLAVDRLGQYPGAGGLAHAPGPAEQEGMRQLVVADGVAQGGRDMGLPDHMAEILRPVLSG